MNKLEEIVLGLSQDVRIVMATKSGGGLTRRTVDAGGAGPKAEAKRDVFSATEKWTNVEIPVSEGGGDAYGGIQKLEQFFRIRGAMEEEGDDGGFVLPNLLGNYSRCISGSLGAETAGFRAGFHGRIEKHASAVKGLNT